jgi:hypothetical protein
MASFPRSPLGDTNPPIRCTNGVVADLSIRHFLTFRLVSAEGIVTRVSLPSKHSSLPAVRQLTLPKNATRYVADTHPETAQFE